MKYIIWLKICEHLTIPTICVFWTSHSRCSSPFCCFKKTSTLLESPYGRVWNMAIGNGAHLITRALVRSSSSQRYSVGFRSGFCAGYSGSFCSSFGKSCLLWSLHCVQGRCCAGRGLGLEFRLKENCNSTAFKDMRLFNASKMTATEPHINLIL